MGLAGAEFAAKCSIELAFSACDQLQQRFPHESSNILATKFRSAWEFVIASPHPVCRICIENDMTESAVGLLQSGEVESCSLPS